MTSFSPAPWPTEISSHFAENVTITEVPAFLHELIAEYTETLASIVPDFRYTNIQVKFTGTVLVYLLNEETYDERVHDALDYMMKELTNAYILAARNSTND
jgi:hypothetical protein